MSNVQDARREMTKTKEQLEEEKKISLSIRIKPLELDGKLQGARENVCVSSLKINLNTKQKVSSQWQLTVRKSFIDLHTRYKRLAIWPKKCKGGHFDLQKK